MRGRFRRPKRARAGDAADVSERVADCNRLPVLDDLARNDDHAAWNLQNGDGPASGVSKGGLVLARFFVAGVLGSSPNRTIRVCANSVGSWRKSGESRLRFQRQSRQRGASNFLQLPLPVLAASPAAAQPPQAAIWS